MLRRLTIGLAAVLSLSGCGGGSTNAAGGTAARSAPSSPTVVVKETEYSLSPAALTLKAGTYTFEIQNLGQFPHDLHVAASADGTEVGGSNVVRAGQSTAFTVALKPGEYTLWCSVDAHRSLGMAGTLTVQ